MQPRPENVSAYRAIGSFDRASTRLTMLISVIVGRPSTFDTFGMTSNSIGLSRFPSYVTDYPARVPRHVTYVNTGMIT